jgi:hypothetical protein
VTVRGGANGLPTLRWAAEGRTFGPVSELAILEDCEDD